MAIAPHAFYNAIGPFGAYNRHYIRDVATFCGPRRRPGGGRARPSWRVPVLAVTTIQFALHSLNHLVDIGNAHPRWTGYFDFFSLARRHAGAGLAAAHGDVCERAAPAAHNRRENPR